MFKKIISYAAITIASLFPLNSFAAENTKFLEPEQAFKLSVSKKENIAVHFEIADGYYLYKERISIDNQKLSNASEKNNLAFSLPEAQKKFDTNFNKEVEYYKHNLDFSIKENNSPTNQPYLLKIKYQGCASAGLCYSPMQAFYEVNKDSIKKVDESSWKTVEEKDIINQTSNTVVKEEKSSDSINSALQSKSYLTIMGVFFIAGLLLSFTPCVLPMIPILSSIIVGQKETPTRMKGFLLALSYSLGMAIVYTLFGVTAGMMGEGLAAWLQNAWVLGGFAIMLSLFSLSMFGFYELQLPSFIQSKATEASSKMEGGSFKGTFLMGGLSALIVGPCVAAPLAGALVYISQTKDLVIGGLSLFSLSSGMSVPLLLVGASAGTLLPQAGSWMDNIKTFFGFLLLGVAVWMINPVLPTAATMILIAFLLILAAVGLWNNNGSDKMNIIKKSISLLIATIAFIQIIGAFAGGSLTQPFANLKSSTNNISNTKTNTDTIEFEKIASKDLLSYIAKNKDKTIMVDFWASWCVSCQEMEHLTFNQSNVLSASKDMIAIKVDVTDNTADDRALMKNFGLFGPPAILFFKDGQEVSSHRLIGFEKSEEFTQRLEKIRSAN